MKRIGILQMCSGIDPEENGEVIVTALEDAAKSSAAMLFTPEMSLLLDRNRRRAASNIVAEGENSQITRLQHACTKTGVWLSLGSCAVDAGEGRWANRTLVISNEGKITARYDKIHMFDVDLASGESWRESNAYEPGVEAVSAETPVGRLGLSICYDIRFPALYQELGSRSCDAITIPAAFTVPTGKAHWHVLQQARAIEASAYIIAAAQTGEHPDGRSTYGHSLVVDPWGDVLLDMGSDVGLGFAEIDHARIAEVRAQLPSLANRRPIPHVDAP